MSDPNPSGVRDDPNWVPGDPVYPDLGPLVLSGVMPGVWHICNDEFPDRCISPSMASWPTPRPAHRLTRHDDRVRDLAPEGVSDLAPE
jgi:hypothetical protein